MPRKLRPASLVRVCILCGGRPDEDKFVCVNCEDSLAPLRKEVV